MSFDDTRLSQAEKRRSRFGAARELAVLVAIAFGLALLLKTFLVQAFWIPSGSMQPTLAVNDRVLVNELAYRFRDPRRGEIVVFSTGTEEDRGKSWPSRILRYLTEGLGTASRPDEHLIKRVIGLPGDTVQIARSVVTITPKSGKPFALEEPYLAKTRDMRPFGPFTVPEGGYLLLGDNRADSADGRSNVFGGLCPSAPCAVPKNRLVGKAFVRIWPLTRIKTFSTPIYGALAIGLAAFILLPLGKDPSSRSVAPCGEADGWRRRG
jgi:signal peptidase I